MTNASEKRRRQYFSKTRAGYLAAIMTALVGSQTGAHAQSCSQPTPMRFEIVNKIVRSQLGFTQGLEFRDGQMYESTGLVNGTTQLNTISLSGQVKTLVDRGKTVFGEGLTILNDEVFQLTWQDNDVFVYELDGKLQTAHAQSARRLGTDQRWIAPHFQRWRRIDLLRRSAFIRNFTNRAASRAISRTPCLD